jgi:hypothetical protein
MPVTRKVAMTLSLTAGDLGGESSSPGLEHKLHTSPSFSPITLMLFTTFRTPVTV